jgi:hypothetical protein
MLPTLKVILATVIAACAVVLTLSAGLIATRDPDERLSGIPSMSRPLVRQAIVDDTEWQSLRLLAYSRRADELQRLRDLPSSPVQAVVEYAERAQKTAEPAPAAAAPAATVVASAPAVPLAAPAEQPAPPSEPIVSAPAAAPAPQPPPAVASAQPVAPPPAEVASAPAVSAPPAEVASAPAVAAPPAPVASAPAAPAPVATIQPPAPVEAPTGPAVTAAIAPPAPSEAPAAAAPAEPAPATASATQVATIQSGSGQTAAIKPTDKPADAKPQHHNKRHGRQETHKKTVRVARTSTTVPPVAKTGFPVDLPQAQAPSTNKSAPVPDTRQDSRARD